MSDTPAPRVAEMKREKAMVKRMREAHPDRFRSAINLGKIRDEGQTTHRHSLPGSWDR